VIVFAAANVAPPSADAATRIAAAPSCFKTQTTSTRRSRMTMRGGCSPPAFASPATSFTRTGAPKCVPPSPLNAA
jgi:hypothetical protein